ncbi:MAG: hypothetical protein ACI9G1_004528, partial [Pirellulaceae bacterium]
PWLEADENGQVRPLVSYLETEYAPSDDGGVKA